MSPSSTLVAPLKIDPAVWRIEIPLVVLERCDSPVQVCVWIAIRWLRAAHQKKRGFGTREIARRANVNQKTVTAAVEHLLEMQLLELVGEEKGKNWKHPRPIYGIPLLPLEQQSAAMAVGVLARWGISDAPPPPPPPEQAQLDFSDPKTVRASEPKTDREIFSDPKTVRTSEPKTDRESDIHPFLDRTSEPFLDRRMDGRMDGGMDGTGAPAPNENENATGLEPTPHIPPAPPSQSASPQRAPAGALGNDSPAWATD